MATILLAAGHLDGSGCPPLKIQPLHPKRVLCVQGTTLPSPPAPSTHEAARFHLRIVGDRSGTEFAIVGDTFETRKLLGFKELGGAYRPHHMLPNGESQPAWVFPTDRLGMVWSSIAYHGPAFSLEDHRVLRPHSQAAAGAQLDAGGASVGGAAGAPVCPPPSDGRSLATAPGMSRARTFCCDLGWAGLGHDAICVASLVHWQVCHWGSPAAGSLKTAWVSTPTSACGWTSDATQASSARSTSHRCNAISL